MENEWVKDFNVIFNGELYKNCVSIRTIINIKNGIEKLFLERLEIIYIDENGNLKMMESAADNFKFVRK